MDPSLPFQHTEHSWSPLTDAELMAIAGSQSSHSRRSQEHLYHGPPLLTQSHPIAGPSSSSSLHAHADFPMFAGLPDASVPPGGSNMGDHSVMEALRLVMNGTIKPQELDQVLPPDVVHKLRGVSSQMDPNFYPSRMTSSSMSTLPPSISHASAGPQTMSADPFSYWMPPTTPSQPYSSGSYTQGHVYPSRPLGMEEPRTSSMTGRVREQSGGRGRTRSGNRRASTSTSATPPIITPPTPTETADTPPQDNGDADDIDAEEDKRRRNTAASARFRAKKKQQVINIERHISDLTSRAEELEKEASDLRRENGWLKEIVMLKGRTHSGGQLSNFGPHDPPADMGGGGPSRIRR